jgi:prepilin-type N-terminal cleavage/methylation domain-containing protein
MSHRRSGFTLIELMLAIMIAIIIVFLALPSLRGLNKEKKLHETFERFDDLAKKAQANAVTQQRAWTLVWGQNAISLEPDEPSPEERMANSDAAAAADASSARGGFAQGGPVLAAPAPTSVTETMTFGPDETYVIERPVALLPTKQVPAEWTFWRSGTCEPVVIKYSGPNGSWVAQYHPLTGHGTLLEERLP